MQVIPAKVTTELQSLLNRQVGKVLVTESHYLALGDKSGELVLSSIAERAELDSLDLCANRGSQVVHAHAIGEQVGIGRISVQPVLNVLKWLEGTVSLLRVPGWKIVRVLDPDGSCQRMSVCESDKIQIFSDSIPWQLQSLLFP